jgi:hypothetical protein
MSLRRKPKKIDLVAQFETELYVVLKKIAEMDDPPDAAVAPAGGPTPAKDMNNYEKIRELLRMFYTIKLNDTNSLLTYLVNKLTILMTKHDTDEEYYNVIIIDTLYDKAISELESELELKNEKFIEIIDSSLKSSAEKGNTFPDKSKNLSTYLYCSLLIIHYYPIVILNTIFSNAKANITSFKTTIPKLIDNYTTNIDTIISGVTSDADSATLAMKAANSAAASADDADADLVQAITHIEAAIARNEAIFTDPKKTDLKLTEAIKTAKDEKISARLISNESSKKSSAATTAATNINAAIISKDPDRIKKAIADAQIPINEATDSVQDTRKATKKLYTYLIKIEPHASKIRPLSSYFGGSNTSDDTMVGGGSDDTKNILSIINDVLDKTDQTGSLIRSSTEIFYKALTILSISIGLPNDFNNENTIITGIKKLVNKYFTEPLTLSLNTTPVHKKAENTITLVSSIFSSNNTDYSMFEGIIDNIFYKYYNTYEKGEVEAFKLAQNDNTKKQNELKALKIKAKNADLALENAIKAQETADAKLISAPSDAKKYASKAAADATNALAAARNALDAVNTASTAIGSLGASPINIGALDNALNAIVVTIPAPPAALPAAGPVAAAPVAAAAADAKVAADAAEAANEAADIAANAAKAADLAVTNALAAAAGSLAAVATPPAPPAAAAAATASNDAAVAAAAAAAAAAASNDAAVAAAAAADYDATASAVKAAADKEATDADAAKAAAKNAEKTAAAAAAAADKTVATKLNPSIPITNMKSTIDEEIAKHFKKIFAPPDSTSAPTKGGQKTQKNRYRGGIHKNMNSIDSFDSIDSDL